MKGRSHVNKWKGQASGNSARSQIESEMGATEVCPSEEGRDLTCGHRVHSGYCVENGLGVVGSGQ